ncbi:MAG: hypothetical protein HOQ24_17345 [Mycobacteriaceae bacterium]|nr:hypothetical protein [Mycobacteriaceae bacterium]
MCDVVPWPMSLDQAHRLIQVHRECSRHCPARRAARAVLVDSGHYRLATRFG